MQTEEGHPEDAVETYLRVLELQEDEDPYDVADAHVQASTLFTRAYVRIDAVGKTLRCGRHMCRAPRVFLLGELSG